MQYHTLQDPEWFANPASTFLLKSLDLTQTDTYRCLGTQPEWKANMTEGVAGEGGLISWLTQLGPRV